MLNDRERDLFRNDEWLVKIGLSRNPFKLFKNLTILFYFFFLILKWTYNEYTILWIILSNIINFYSIDQ